MPNIYEPSQEKKNKVFCVEPLRFQVANLKSQA